MKYFFVQKLDEQKKPVRMYVMTGSDRDEVVKRAKQLPLLQPNHIVSETHVDRSDVEFFVNNQFAEMLDNSQ
jgi:hypothetical protein